MEAALQNGTYATPAKPAPTSALTHLQPILDDLAYLRTVMVNVYLVGPAGAADRGWVLVDTGLPGFADHIRKQAAQRFGSDRRPVAILLTHGHFDHVGNVQELADAWEAPVLAHPLELPYLTGRSPYPPADPRVGGGAMAALSALYPRSPINLGARVQPLPADGSVPGLPGWRWLPTPGHSPGHVSFFRETDRTLLAGDAFVTVAQESALAVLTQKPEVHGPPMYFTPDWGAAAASVRHLAALEPEVAATGHGLPLRGVGMRQALARLAANFEREAVPTSGRYVPLPAVTDERGLLSVPSLTPPAAIGQVVAGSVAAFGLGLALGRWLLHRR